jgi:hypothetical protein
MTRLIQKKKRGERERLKKEKKQLHKKQFAADCKKKDDLKKALANGVIFGRRKRERARED